MKLANCSRCGRVFSFVPGTRDICPACIQLEDDHFLKVFHFLTQQPSATAPEIAEATGIDIKEILRFVRENRLRLVRMDPSLTCESCGNPISQGKICDNCAGKLSAEMRQEVTKTKQNPPKTGPAEPSRDPKYLKDRRGRQKP